MSSSSKRSRQQQSSDSTSTNTNTNSSTSTTSTSDAACASCRDRKVRCDRQKPQCSNCRETGVECDYTAPGKRVNHIKLLCDTVGNVERRIQGLETQLQAMASATASATNLQAEAPRGGPAPTAVMVGPRTPMSEDDFDDEDDDDDDAGAFANNTTLKNGTARPAPSDRHIRSSSRYSGQSYHGPGSLFDLCLDFRNTALSTLNSADEASMQQSRELGSDNRHRQAVNLSLEKLCNDASDNSLVRQDIDPASEELLTSFPPQGVVLAAASQFFRQVDFVTDIFDENSFYAHLDRAYAESVVDPCWAICCRVIILLVCATELVTRGSQSLLGGFARPYLTDGLSAVAYRRISTEARLINVQTLILLSLCAQQFDPPGWSELLFAQACLLSRLMGLHQLHPRPHDVSNEPADELERCKVLRSLYLRDKGLALRRGFACWLPLDDCILPSNFGLSPSIETGDSLTAHLQLASVQDDLYRLIHAAGSRRQPSRKTTRLGARMNAKLGELSRSSLWIDSKSVMACADAFKLDFFATRIYATSRSANKEASEIMLRDSIASCLVLLAGCNRHDAALVERLGRMLPKELQAPYKAHSSTFMPAGAGQSQQLSLHTLLVSFSPWAFFILAKHLMTPPSGLQSNDAEAVLDLLQRVAICYKSQETLFESRNFCQNLSNAFDQALRIVSMIQFPGMADELAILSEHSVGDKQPLDYSASIALPPQGEANALDFALPSSDPWTSSTMSTWDMSLFDDVSMCDIGLVEAFGKPFSGDLDDTGACG